MKAFLSTNKKRLYLKMSLRKKLALSLLFLFLSNNVCFGTTEFVSAINKTGEDFNIVFDEETIKDLSHNFFKSGFQKNSKLEHKEIIEGVTVVESWLVENPKIDKSTNFGFEYPKGSWVGTMKVDNDEIWNDFVKTGKVQGFSVDAFIDLEEIQLNKNDNMEQTKIAEAIENGFKKFFSKKVEFNTQKSGDIQIQFEGELKAGAKVFELKDEKQIALSVGDYPIDDKKTLVVEEEGIAKEIKEPVAVVADGMTEETADAIGLAIAKALGAYQEKEEVRFKAIEDNNKALKVELEKLGKQPAADAITMAAQAAANAVKLDKGGVILEAIRNAKAS